MEVKKGYKPTEAGLIPDDWEVRTLSKVSTFLDGKRRPVKDSDRAKMQGAIPYYGASGIVDYVNDFLFDEDLILLGEDGENIVSRNTRLAFRISGKTWVNNHAHVIKPNPEVSLGFLCDYLESLNYEQYNSGTAQPKLNKHTCNLLPVALPPTLAEQEAIAGALSDADAWIESLEQLIAKKRQIKQGTMQELLTGKRRLPGFSGSWQRLSWGDVIDECTSGATPYRGRTDFYDGSVKWITSGELNYNVIHETIEHISEEARRRTNLRLHPPGTFLMAITGLEAAGTRGACGIVGSLATTNQSCMAVYTSPKLRTGFLYHFYVLKGNELAFEYCQGTKQQSYTAKLVKLLPIDLPPSVLEQEAIATILFEMDFEISDIEIKLTKARQIKQAMMQELLTGRIRLVESGK